MEGWEGVGGSLHNVHLAHHGTESGGAQTLTPDNSDTKSRYSWRYASRFSPDNPEIRLISLRAVRINSFPSMAPVFIISIMIIQKSWSAWSADPPSRRSLNSEKADAPRFWRLHQWAHVCCLIASANLVL